MDVAVPSRQLLSEPQILSDCCLALSSTLIAHLASLLPREPGFTVSIGSGGGLLEALIAHRHPEVSVRGVEVHPNVNRYLAEQDINVVRGTWELYAGVAQAAAWMFVYPREPQLVTKYLDTYGHTTAEIILWLGPRVDWPDYEPCFRRSLFTDCTFPEEVGLSPYEMLAVLRKSSA